MANDLELWVSRGTSLAEPISASYYRKAAPPTAGDRYGWWNDETVAQRLPGGSIMTFNLNALTLDDYRVMRSDYQLNASLNVLQALIAQADFSIHTKGEESDPKAKTISNTLEEGIRRYWIPFIRAISASHWCGFAPTVPVYELQQQSGYYEITKYKDLTPENCRVNWRLTKGADNTPIRKFNGILNSGRTIPVDNSFWYPIMMENGNYYGRKLLQPAFPAWFFSQLIHLYTNRYFERFGEPTPIGYYPADDVVRNDDGTTSTARDVMAGVLQNLRNRGVVQIPSQRDTDTKELEWDIKYLESNMRGADFERYLDRLDEEKSLALFTPTLLFRTGSTGSYNLSSQHLLVFQWILNALVGDLKTYVDEYIIKRLHDINFGPNAPRSEIRFRTLGRLDDTGAMSILQALIQNKGAKLAETGLRDLGNQIGIDLEYVNGMGAPPGGATTLESAVAGLLPNSQAPNQNQNQNTPPTPEAKNQLVSARRRLEEQVRRTFRTRDGYDREYALRRIKLGFKGAFINDMTHAGANPDGAERFFHTLESSLRDVLAECPSESDALVAIESTYADYGLVTD